MKRGVKGLFYRDDSLAILKKGIHAVLGGELWFSRRSLSKYLAESRRMKMPVEEEKQILLTFREREILAMIADGLSKDDIAVDLGISPHTVKTHTHNIYQKINVPNRVKAAMWANRNLKFPRRTVRDSAARKSYHS